MKLDNRIVMSKKLWFFSDSGNQSGENPPAIVVVKKPPTGEHGDPERDPIKRAKSERPEQNNSSSVPQRTHSGKHNDQLKSSLFKYGELIVLG